MTPVKIWQDRRWTVFSAVLTGGRGVLDLRLVPELAETDAKRDRLVRVVRDTAALVEGALVVRVTKDEVHGS